MTTEHRPQVASDEVRPHPAHREITRPVALRAVLSAGVSLHGARIQDVDLGPYEADLLAREDLAGLVVLGGEVSDRLAHHLRLHGALVFPTDPTCPVNPYRATLYRPEELYDGMLDRGYASTPDALAYAWSREADQAHDVFVTLVRAIHDDSVSDALTEALDARRVVGVMGGHALLRGTPEYAGAARLGHLLARAGDVVLTGGGPGAMEAANLGALAPDDAALDAALEALGAVPSFRPDVQAWAALALEVREVLLDEGPVRSVGVPTWFYGHEPPNVFGQGVAKYFSNALREDALLSRCTAGLVVLPGAAGTVQEIFQAVTPLYYAAEGVPVPPLVLVDETHWERTIPVLPALRALGAQRGLGASTHVVGTVEEAAALLAG
ncbi:LOG family protein [Janibacter melonis]|uniref:LOG family protein n=1 Tax=Janibacter melonis TaxID=262209 RepID=UPI001918EBAB|nr:LOG family protein [Janibacter melonis]